MEQIIKDPPVITGYSFTVSCFFIRNINGEHKVFLRSDKSRKLHGLHSCYKAEIENPYFHVELDHEGYIQSFRDFITAMLDNDNQPYFNEGQIDYLVKAETHRDSLRDSLLAPYVRQLIATYLECTGAYVEDFVYLGYFTDSSKNHHGFLVSSVGVKNEDDDELMYLLHTDSKNRFDIDFRKKTGHYSWVHISTAFSHLYGDADHCNKIFYTEALLKYLEYIKPHLLNIEKENIIFYQNLIDRF